MRKAIITKKVSSLYHSTAIIFFNTFLLLFLINIAILGIFELKKSRSQSDLINSNILKAVYPHLDEAEITDVQTIAHKQPYVYAPYIQYKERAIQSKLVNIEHEGFRRSQHQGPWPIDLKATNIFIFGGSTTFGFRVPDNDTLASHLQEYLTEKAKHNIYVYNFGHLGFFSTQERILFEQLMLEGNIPDSVIFIDGLNELGHPNGMPSHTNLLKNFVDNMDKNRNFTAFFQQLPMNQALTKLLNRFSQTTYQEERKFYPTEKVTEQLLKRYLDNKRIIEAVAKTYRVKPFFIWQPIPTYNYDMSHHLFAKNIDSSVINYTQRAYTHMAQIVEQKTLGDNFFWLANMQQDIKQPLYVDSFHYSSNMMKIMAEKIGGWLINNPISEMNIGSLESTSYRVADLE